jgi:hypothetical protein
MCVHTWVLLAESMADRFYFRCQRCRAVVSLGFVLGVLHVNVHGERGPVVSPRAVQQLVDSVLGSTVVHPIHKHKHKKRKAA